MDIVREVPETQRYDAPDLPRGIGGNWLSGVISLPMLLRTLGATILIAAAATFMLQEWSSMSHVARYFSFLGFTLLLSLSGFVCGLKLKEDKGARTFLALAAAVVPVHFCQLGALIYSRFPEAAVSYPSWLLWKAPSTAAAFGTTAVGLIALVPVIFVSFSSLVRSEAMRLTATYLAINAFLLLPTRAPDNIAVVAIVMFCMAVRLELNMAQQASVMRTKEGCFVRLMMWVPLVLLCLRALNLYSMSHFLFSAMSGCTAAFLFFVVSRQFAKPTLRAVVEVCSVAPSFVAIVSATAGLERLGVIGVTAIIPTIFLPFAAVLWAMSFEAARFGRAYRTVGTLVALLAMALQLSCYPGLLSATYCIVAGIVAACAAFHSESRSLLCGGVALFGAGIIYYIAYAIEVYAFSPWMSLAALGIAVVFSASLAERKSAYLSEEARRIRERIASWN